MDGSGPLARLRDGDVIRLDATQGLLQVMLAQAEWDARPCAAMPEELRLANSLGMGRELFAATRRNSGSAEQGATTW